LHAIEGGIISVFEVMANESVEDHALERVPWMASGQPRLDDVAGNVRESVLPALEAKSQIEVVDAE
tara:strand:+ start:569 stop:766 length:198 start_codon:yes stop_codon:yes gene_type:complete